MPIPVTCPGCGTKYNLKDDLAGKALRCRQCQGVVQVPAAPVEHGLTAVPPTSRAAPPPLPGGAADERIGPPPLPRARRDDAELDYDQRDYDRDYDDDERSDDDLDPAFQRDKFLLRQKHFSINEKYYVQDEKGRDILFVERPIHAMQSCLAALAGIGAMLIVMGLFAGIGYLIGHAAGDRVGLFIGIFTVIGIPLALLAMAVLILMIAPKRHIQFYADDSKRELLLEVLQDKKFAPINATYTVVDPDGKVLARLRKNYLYNFFRKRWYVYYPDGEDMMMALEDSLIMSLLRRFGPLFALWRTNFIFTKPDGETVIGEFIRKFTLFDRYILDMTRDRRGYIDRRVAVALGILLDTGEQR